MKNAATKTVIIAAAAALCAVLCFCFGRQLSYVFAKAAVISASKLLPSAAITVPSEAETDGESENKSTDDSTQAQTESTSKEETTVKAAVMQSSFYETPDDIQKLIAAAEKAAANDKKDGDIYEKQYVNEGVTDKYGVVKVKNTNKTQIDIKSLLSQKADLSVDKSEPTVLIFHTHTTESYQLLDRDFYAEGYTARSSDANKNMVRVGDEICAELEANGFSCIHDKTVHDTKYSGAYERSRQTVIDYLKKYPSIQVVLDIHRDAIEETNGTKIKPTAEINGKKAAQVMIITGCQEEGNGIEDFKDWKYNLIFALKLQKSMEENFPGLTRPVFFCPRRYNMNLTRCSLLLEVGSDSNTLEEAVFSGKCIGKALSVLLEDYKED